MDSIHTISNKWKDYKTNLVLLLDKVTEKREKADHLTFLKFLFADLVSTHWVLLKTQANSSQIQKNAFFVYAFQN